MNTEPVTDKHIAGTDGESEDMRSIRRHLIAGTALAGFLVFGVGTWAASASIASAVIAPGTLVVDSNIKSVQHPSGGVVGHILARDGDIVAAGDVLVRLDDTIIRAELAVVEKELDELQVRTARLEAERLGATDLVVREEFHPRTSERAVDWLVKGERRLFEARRAEREGRRAQFEGQIVQLEHEIAAKSSQAAANAQDAAIIGDQLRRVRTLWERQLTTMERLATLEREAIRVRNVGEQLGSENARAEARIAEIRTQIAQIDRDLASEVEEELRKAEARMRQLAELQIAGKDRLRRVDIRAPQDGTVHQSTVHTVGGVIVPDGQAIMKIVPENEELEVEAEVRPEDVDQIAVGDEAVLRLSAFNQRTTPEITGIVSRISADITRDPTAGRTFYTVRIGVPEAEKDRLGGIRLIPGMPVEAFVQTGERTVLSYIVKPFADQLARAFRQH